MTHHTSHNLPNARRIATARAALTTAMAVRADCPVISDDAVIEMLADLRHFCAGRNNDFATCNDVAQEHFQPRDERRPPMSLLTDEIRERLLQNGKIRLECSLNGEAEPDFLPVVKLFMPESGFAWLLTEIDPDAPDIAFGLCDLGMGFPELGNVSLSEIEMAAKVSGLIVQRDALFVPTKTISVYAREARARGGICA